jgi:hypothetical protein
LAAIFAWLIMEIERENGFPAAGPALVLPTFKSLPTLPAAHSDDTHDTNKRSFLFPLYILSFSLHSISPHSFSIQCNDLRAETILCAMPNCSLIVLDYLTCVDYSCLPL